MTVLAGDLRKVVICVLSSNIGGAETQALNLAMGLKNNFQMNVSFLILCENDGPLITKLNEYGIEYQNVDFSTYHFDYLKKFPLSPSGLKLLWEAKKMLRKVERKIAELNPDVLIPFTFYPNAVACLFKRKSVSGLGLWNQRDLGVEGFTGSYFERKAMKQADVLVANSHAGKEFVESKFSFAGQVNIISNSVVEKITQKNRSEWRNELGIWDGDIVFTMISNIHSNKDHLTLVKAFCELVKRESVKKIHLILAGRVDSKCKASLLDILKENSLESFVHFPGFVKDTTGLLRASDYFVFSSFSEGSPNVVIEAVLSELPVITSKIPAVKEIFGDDYPLYFSPGDHKECAERMAYAVERRDSSLSRKYREKIEKDFSLEQMCNRYLGLVSNFKRTS